MSPRQIRIRLYLATAACVVAATGVWAWGVWQWQQQARADTEISAGVRAARPATRLLETPPLADFTVLDTRRFRPPLVDPPPPPPPTPRKQRKPGPRRNQPQRPRVTWKLVGTVLEDGNSAAILIDDRGKVNLKREGDTIESQPPGAVVRTIELRRVTLAVNDQTITLELPRPEMLP